MNNYMSKYFSSDYLQCPNLEPCKSFREDRQATEFYVDRIFDKISTPCRISCVQWTYTTFPMRSIDYASPRSHPLVTVYMYMFKILDRNILIFCLMFRSNSMRSTTSWRGKRTATVCSKFFLIWVEQRVS